MKIDEIELDRIDLQLGKKIVLNNITISIKKNEKIAIIGPAGAGKTSLLYIISLLIKPINGSIKFNKINPWHLNSSKLNKVRKNFFFVPQVPPLPGRQRVVTSVQAGLISNWSLFTVFLSLFYPIKFNEVLNILEEIGLKDKIMNRVESLSGGEKQCVSLARLLISKANIMVVDEPLNSLDPKRSEMILKIIIKYNTLFSSNLVCSLHQPFLAKKYFSRIIGIKNSKIVFDLPNRNINKKIINNLYN